MNLHLLRPYGDGSNTMERAGLIYWSRIPDLDYSHVVPFRPASTAVLEQAGLYLAIDPRIKDSPQDMVLVSHAQVSGLRQRAEAAELRVKTIEALCKDIGGRARLASWGVSGSTVYYWLEVKDREQLLDAGRGKPIGPAKEEA